MLLESYDYFLLFLLLNVRLGESDTFYHCSDWIAFTSPKELKIPGHVICHCLHLNGTFTVSIVDAIMVLWSCLDAKMHSYYQDLDEPHSIWRHFLPASFAEMVHDDADYLNSHEIQSIFIGDHISYNVEDCQQIILPVLGEEHTWSCYIWDFKLKTITVLDPLLMRGTAAEARDKHQQTVFKLHNALFACKDHFFSGWDVQHQGWNDVYINNLGHQCTWQNSGLYAVHYARAYCGRNKLAWKLKEPEEPTLCEARGEILYHFMTCPSNRGYKSELLLEKIYYFEM